MRFRTLLPSTLLLSALYLAPAASAQQRYVSRYDVFGGYAFLDSPKIGLFSNGFQFQFGMRPRTWYSLGFDYSYSRGDLTLTPDLLPDGLRATLQGVLAQVPWAKLGINPATYKLVVPASSITQTFAVGPQLAYRHFRHLTLFVRPSMGAIREVATPKPTDAVATLIVTGLAPTGKKRDWQGFYGVGYGFDILLTNHVALRTQGDLAYDHLFNDILKDGRWTARFSTGLAFNFGRNIAE